LNSYMVFDLLAKFEKGLSRTKDGLSSGLTKIVGHTRKIDRDFLAELEELLILSDVGVETAEIIIQDIEKKSRDTNAVDRAALLLLLKEELLSILQQPEKTTVPFAKPYVISIVGVNGTGKTTSIAKLAYKFSQDGKKVVLAAADTFRAAAIEQLGVWAQRTGAELIKSQAGADPAAVAFDALKATIARGLDILIVDTAGRLHTKANLMTELSKIHRVLNRQIPEAPHQVLLVMDATTGQNGLSQARSFIQAVKIDGIILTKLDGTAKGGIVFAISKELKIPVRFIGIGEQLDDFQEFDANLFVEALLQ
jgi:fused signal recognition particle receptor